MNPDSIGIRVVPRYIVEESQPDDDQYFFSYTITVSNGSDRGVKLLSREWLITDGNGRTQEVSGEGVVGQQPHIAPGESFTYTSAAQLQTPVGTMEGYYHFRSDDEDWFRVRIQPFLLSYPGAVN